MKDEAPPRRILVGFHDHGCFLGACLLRRGFRHVLAAIDDGRAWIVIDPRLDGIMIDASLPASFDLAGAWRAAGVTVVETHGMPRARPRPWRLAPFTCVEVVKNVLSLRRPRIVTPFTLYRHLIGSLEHGSLVQSRDAGDATAATATQHHQRRS